MSRRNQSRRRRAYGRRQHEVRERRPGSDSGSDWAGELDGREAWLAPDAPAEQRAFDQDLGGLGR